MPPLNRPEPHLPLRFLLSGRRVAPIRRIILLGFTAIFGLWLISAYVLGQRVLEADRRAASITTEFTRGEELLFSVREQILVSSVLVRDAALDNRPDVVASHRAHLQQIRDDAERKLQAYLPHVDSSVEREHWTRLRGELSEYWMTVSPLLTGEVTGTAAQSFLQRTVIPKRDLVLRISENLRVLNQDAFRDQQTAVTDLHRAVRTRIWWTSGLAVAFGLVVALVAARYTGRLESWIRQQHREERTHKRELQRLSAELEDARENERRTIARDLHDEIGQALTTIKLDLGVVERSGHLSDRAAAALAEARSSTELAIHTVRDLSQLLHPPMLDDFGLAVTLEAYLRGFSARSGVRTEIALDRMDARVPSNLEVCAYRVVQEALTNVAKHAKAASCRVTLQRRPYSLLVTVEDDGIGMVGPIADDTRAQHGVGLVSVRERVSRAEGTVRIESLPGKGTRLTVELPVPLRQEITDQRPSGAEPSTGAVAVRG